MPVPNAFALQLHNETEETNKLGHETPFLLRFPFGLGMYGFQTLNKWIFMSSGSQGLF